MAKVIFYKSPIDSRNFSKFFTDKKNIEEILIDLKISNDEVNIYLNGKETKLNLDVNKNDVLEIKKIVEGDAGSKETASTIIQLAALIAAPFTGGASLYVLAGGTLISTGLSMRAAYLRKKAAQEESKDQVDTDTNNYSLNAATNEARPLAPIALPMGSFNYAPDYHGQPYPGFWGGDLDSSLQAADMPFSPGIDNPENWLSTYPAGQISNSPYTWPTHDLKIMPGLDVFTINLNLTTDQQKIFAPYFELFGQFRACPIILWHGDPADPHYGKYTTLAALQLQGTQASSQLQAINDYNYWFDNLSVPEPGWWSNVQFDFGGSGLLAAFWPSPVRRESGTISEEDIFIRWQPTQPGFSPMWYDYMTNELNGNNSYPNTNPTITRSRQNRIVTKYIEPRKQTFTHVFNLGVGDIDIIRRSIQKTEIENIAELELNNPNRTFGNFDSWKFPPTLKSSYIGSTKIFDGAELVNDEDFSGPEFYVPPNDNNNYNFVYRTFPKRTKEIQIDLEGNLYTAGPDGISENTTRFELKTRINGGTWSTYDNPILNFVNDNTKTIRQTVVLEFPFVSDSDVIEIKIRKMDLDSVNNSSVGDEINKIASFRVNFFKAFILDDFLQDRSIYLGQNIDGIFLVGNTNANGQTDKYTVSVEAKCWVYDSEEEEWVWKQTRNPAWWFLYYVRGGFFNPEAVGSYTYPWSPTYGWVNGPGHPENSDRIFGAGLPDDRIDIDKIIEWANFCEEKNLYLDMLIREDENVSFVMEKIANVGRASVSYYRGITSVIYEDENQPSSGVFGMADMIPGSFSVDYIVTGTPYKVVGTFTNRDNDFESDTVEALVPFQNSENKEVFNITLEGVTDPAQAQREINILAARQFFQKRIYSWKTDQQGLAASRGDIVQVSHDSTQFGYSGRISKFILNESIVVGIETTSNIKDNAISHVLIKDPSGNLNIYECHAEGCVIWFDEEYPLNLTPEFPENNNDNINESSDFPESMPDDFTFIADIKSTPGKRLRITECRPVGDFEFEFSAIDDDPAMWSYEYGPIEDPQSFDDSIPLLEILNCGYTKLGDGSVKIFWESNAGDFVQIINLDNGQPIESNGSYSFSFGEVILELTAGSKYTLEIKPFSIGQNYRSISKRIVVWA